MDELIYILFIIFILIAPLLEKVMKKQPPPVERRSPGPDHAPDRASRTIGLPAPAPPGTTARHGDSRHEAELVIPDELWEILTGERRRPPPVSLPEPVDEEEVYAGWTTAGESLETEVPEPFSYDTDAERPYAAVPPARQAEEMDRMPAPPVRRLEPALPVRGLFAGEPGESRLRTEISKPLEVIRTRRRHPVLLRLDDPEDLRRAVLLREVLGPPRALE